MGDADFLGDFTGSRPGGEEERAFALLVIQVVGHIGKPALGPVSWIVPRGR